MDYDYNTSRKRLVLPEYGRNVQKMVDHVLSIEDREERNKAAKTLIGIMGALNPQLRDFSDFKHKLWDHLAIMADFKIDIDSPYVLPTKEILTEKPKQVPYIKHNIRYKHYGRVIEQMVEEAVKVEDTAKREIMTKIIANHMKKAYLTWNRENVSDESIFHDLKELSAGQLIANPEWKLSETRDILNQNRRPSNNKKNNQRKNKQNQ
jgi:hypothetical protein